jgi:hypothetical protein
MYSFFELSSSVAARAMAATGALIITMVMMATAIVPASPNAATLTVGVLA